MDQGQFEFRGAPGGTAGDPITWNTVEYDGTTDEFDFAQATTSDVVWDSGSTRPASPQVGQRFFDTSIDTPVWWTGTDWVDGSGTVV